MAYERTDTRIKGEGLDAFIANTMTLFKNQLTIRNAEEENNFNRAIVEQDLSLAEQLDYRKEQLKRVGDDKDERKRINEEIKTLKSLAEQQKFSEEYLSKVGDVSAGITSLDSVINWLTGQLETAVDSSTRTAISKALADKKAEKFQLTQTLLENQTQYALSDKTEEIINTQINRVTAERNKARLAGNDTLVSSLDLNLQSLNKALNENLIEKDIKNFAVATVTGYASSVALLDAYNNKISSSASTGPVKIGDVTYASSQEFWKFKRDSYLADNSESGFFTRFNSEKNTEIKVKNSQNSLATNTIKNISAEYDSLLTRPELANYQSRVASTKQDSIQTGVGLLSENILNNFNINYDLQKATSGLNILKSIGANVEDAYSKLINSATALKSSQINSIVASAQAFMQNDFTLLPSDAVNLAISKGYGSVLSPSQLITAEPKETANKIVSGAGVPGEPSKGTFGQPDTRLTTPSANLPEAAATPPPVVTPPAQQNQTSATPASATPTPATLFNKQLDFGATDPQVKELQKFLNTQGFKVAESGEGSAGFETNYFGPLTQKALQKFQAAQGIVSTGDAATTGYGRLGPQTLSAINKLLGVK